ncbi:hypothetical protein BO443_120123 [Burkholderia orbicola]
MQRGLAGVVELPVHREHFGFVRVAGACRQRGFARGEPLAGQHVADIDADFANGQQIGRVGSALVRLVRRLRAPRHAAHGRKLVLAEPDPQALVPQATPDLCHKLPINIDAPFFAH